MNQLEILQPETKTPPFQAKHSPGLSMRPVRLGVIGCGGHAADGHLLPLRNSALLDVGGLFDPVSSSAARLSEALSGRPALFDSEHSLLAGDCEAVMIASPDRFHCASLLAAVKRGKHVFVEKPLAISSRELPDLAEALMIAAGRGLIVSSCHPRRFDPPFLWLKESQPSLLLRFGRALSFEYDFSYHAPSQVWKQSRSLLLDHANHEIDLLHFIFGTAPGSARKLNDGPDRYMVQGERADGIAFSFIGTRCLNSRVFRESAAIRYERGALLLDATAGLAVIEDHESGRRERVTCGGTDYALRGSAVLENFMLAIRGQDRSYLSTSDLMLNTSFGIMLNETGRWDSDSALGRP